MISDKYVQATTYLHRQTNLSKVSKASYERMMHENATKTYKKCNTNKSISKNIKAKQIASKLKLMIVYKS